MKKLARSEKLDLYKKHKEEYAATRTPRLVDLSKARYLCIQGKGKPGDESFTEHVGTLYNMAFTIKIQSKAAGRDYSVCKLEGLWWGQGRNGVWKWKLLIRIPEFIQEKHRQAALVVLEEKGKGNLVEMVTLETLNEGRCVQLLHVGPYDQERESITTLEKFAKGLGLSLHGEHHEIYLSDPRRVAPEKLRTILRHPVR
ncbi:MAG: GyrI-like domain-containing protein [Planctomycetota bacterium]